MAVPSRIAQASQQRVDEALDKIRSALQQIEHGRPLDAEPNQDRKINRIAQVVGVSRDTARDIANYEDPRKLGLQTEEVLRAEALQGKTVDYLGVAWLEAGRLASSAVARVLTADGVPLGTGFLVSERLFLTNNHVIQDASSAAEMVVEFGYEVTLNQPVPRPARFRLNPSTFFETSDRDDLDFTLLALGAPISRPVDSMTFSSCPLSKNAAKHSVGELVNLVQHPDGDYKQIVIRENRIVHRGDFVLHYLADTEPGASGSPVFNDQWQPVALHHWGGPHREQSVGGQSLPKDVNEGIRISCIIEELERRTSRMDASRQALLQRALDAPAPSEFGTRLVSTPFYTSPHAIQGGSMRPTLPDPIRTATREREGRGEPASLIDRNYRNRRGYNPRFLRGLAVPMPQLSADMQEHAARVSGVGRTTNPFELKYQHFSVVQNATRRMPFFSIVNIDGSKRVRINRETGVATPEMAEATEVWAVDDRVPVEAQLDDAFYSRLRRAFRFSDFTARGHMTRREDPVWGEVDLARRANNDTFHHTNACPQMQTAFNGSQRVWLGIENYVLDAADDANLRVTVITGPVLADDDPVFQDSELGAVQIPRLFWKIVARVEDGEPKVFAVLADQSEALDALLSAPRREESFEWPTKLSLEFRSTVAEVARLTGLDFGDLADHDVFAGGEESLRVPIRTAEDLVGQPRSEAAFGKYASIAEFLEAYREHQRGDEARAEDPGAEGRKKKRKAVRGKTRERDVAEVQAHVERVFADDLSGARHQQFTVVLNEVSAVSERIAQDVSDALDAGNQVRLAVRYGDNLGLRDRIPGIRKGVALTIKGEWIPASEAYAVGGERMAVLHFTHDPLGYVCTESSCYE